MNQHQPPRRAAFLIAALLPALSGCINVRAPERPIEINLNVTIRQEVLVRLQRDVDQLINENPDLFPQGTPRQAPAGQAPGSVR